MSTSDDCVFCQILRGQVPAKVVHRDDMVICFHDIRPAAPLHLLVVSRDHIESLAVVDSHHAGVLSHMLLLAGKLATEHGSPDGFRFVFNTGRIGCQEVMHLHGHILGGPDPLALRRWAVK
ncbi:MULTISPECIES: HIT domain-containing protein [Candidatus Ichthyocystis]|uniref:HIT family protein n=1 Tax=Candidatus Ichthyocystis hellenicum TaxID=1561003 RepID=A0A0S4M020_9BURK|nr:MULTISPECIES: HIT domain-containing protein [Ichthyocystis]CUT17155.1 HIT family protein [Candidatus Ichthyocystis hellenicum]